MDPTLDNSSHNLVDLREYLAGAMNSIEGTQQDEAHLQTQRMGSMQKERKKKKKKDKDGKKSKKDKYKGRDVI